MKINPDKSKAVSFTKARVNERTRSYFGGQLIPEASSFKYLGIIIRNDLTGQIMSITPYEKHEMHFIP